MKTTPVLALGLLFTPLLFPVSSLAQVAPAAPGQAAPAVPLRYAFSESFPTQFSPRSGDGFRAQGIAVDGGGQVYLTAKDEGIV